MFFLEYKKITIALILCLAGIAAYYAMSIQFYHDLDRFQADGGDDIAFLADFQNKLDTDDDYYLIGIHREEGIFQSKFFKKLAAFTSACDTLPYILKATSITNISNPLKTPFAMVTVPIIHIDDESKYRKDSINIMSDERLVGRFVGRSGKTAVVVLKTENGLKPKQTGAMDQHIKALINDFNFEATHVVGKACIQTEFSKLLAGELKFFIYLSSLFLLIVLALIFKRFWMVVIALVSVALGGILFGGFLGVIGEPLDLLGMLFPPLMMIVGMSDVVHFLSKYNDEIKSGRKQLPAMIQTIKEIGWATFLTSGTTAIGFCALYFSDIEPIRSFGIKAAVGVLVAFATVLFFTTCVLLLFDKKRIITKKREGRLWTKIMHLNFLFVQKHPKSVLYATAAIVVICLIGISKLDTNSYLLSDLPAHSELLQDVNFFEKELTGIRTYELAILPQKDYKISEAIVLREIDKLENFLKTETQIKTILGPTTPYKTLHRAYKANKAKAYVLPSSDKKLEKYRRDLKKMASTRLGVLISDDEKLGRITGMVEDIGTLKTKELNDKVRNWTASNIQSDIIKIKPTGSTLKFDKNRESLTSSMFKSLMFALISVSLLMSILFKNARMIIISLVPNILPLLVTAAIIGYFHIELKGPTSIIFAIAFGIAVDATIHFLSKYKIERDKGKSVREAIYRTYIETGKAINLTTLILFFGFFLLIFSDFTTVAYVGILISFSLIAALAATMFILPLSLLWFLGGYKEPAYIPGARINPNYNKSKAKATLKAKKAPIKK